MKPSQNKERIAKVLARAGIASRREIERMIEAGRIQYRGKVVTTPVTFIRNTSNILIDGKVVGKTQQTRLWLYHKPKGLVTTHKDPGKRSTVFENLPDNLPRVVSVGRLDINTEGLLLLTNDGELARFLEHPSNGLERTYRVRVHGKIVSKALDNLKTGITVEGIKYGAIYIKIEKKQRTNTWLIMTLAEGKNREIKNVLGHLGLKVNRLIRTNFGPFTLGHMGQGTLLEVSAEKINEIWKEKV